MLYGVVKIGGCSITEEVIIVPPPLILKAKLTVSLESAREKSL